MARRGAPTVSWRVRWNGEGMPMKASAKVWADQKKKGSCSQRPLFYFFAARFFRCTICLWLRPPPPFHLLLRLHLPLAFSHSLTHSYTLTLKVLFGCSVHSRCVETAVLVVHS